MNYKLAIFDFDGTLADSFPFFIGVFNTLAEKHRFKSISPAEIPTLRGYGARQMMQHVEMPIWKLPLVSRDFIGLMRASAASICTFDGVEATLQALHERGVAIAIVSSNATDNVTTILGPACMRYIGHLDCGASILGKTTRIRKVVRKYGIPKEQVIYIGDQATDLEASRKAGVDFGAVSWGYATPDSLRALAPEREFRQLSDITQIA
ncbi:HAD hydrolase-like protein [Pseudomonas sp. PDM16]|uniref:HAD hydrolase-like protein n=1 Tax=Pseudomonas sp. PDM16 TaxID=2769292 RepID=UPI0017817BC8|nr:HAD hydrolase-like protein [Pseudomonas sp. PDM16]MBD9414170.1 HAD hydrolase-like protein [Pseudomonas sp. PDM16]